MCSHLSKKNQKYHKTKYDKFKWPNIEVVDEVVDDGQANFLRTRHGNI